MQKSDSICATKLTNKSFTSSMSKSSPRVNVKNCGWSNDGYWRSRPTIFRNSFKQLFCPLNSFFSLETKLSFDCSKEMDCLKDSPGWTDFAGDAFGDADFFMVLFFGLGGYFFLSLRKFKRLSTLKRRLRENAASGTNLPDFTSL